MAAAIGGVCSALAFIYKRLKNMHKLADAMRNCDAVLFAGNAGIIRTVMKPSMLPRVTEAGHAPWRPRGPLLAFVCALLLSGCSLLTPKFERPNLSVVGIQMLDGNFFQQNFLVRLKLQNPNDRALPVNGLGADLTIAGEPFAVNKGTRRIEVTISIGLSTLELKGEAVADVLKRADTALYRAKHDGRNRVVSAAA